jgi:hypothetical protein
MKFTLAGGAVPDAFAARCATLRELRDAAQDAPAAADDDAVCLGSGTAEHTLQLLLRADAAAWGDDAAAGSGEGGAHAAVAAVVRDALLRDEARNSTDPANKPSF